MVYKFFVAVPKQTTRLQSKCHITYIKIINIIGKALGFQPVVLLYKYFIVYLNIFKIMMHIINYLILSPFCITNYFCLMFE